MHKNQKSRRKNSIQKKWIILAITLLSIGLFMFSYKNGLLLKTSLYIDNELQEKNRNYNSYSLKYDTKKFKNQIVDCDVVVVGGGTGGIAAAISSSREGAKTCLIEETDWLGGMLTAAGVSAIDGRNDNISGIFYEIIKEIEKYYSQKGQKYSIYQCTVSYLCFEPHVGDIVIKKLVEREKNLKVFLNSEINKVYRENNKVLGISFVQNNKTYVAKADVTIDATEYGDLMFLANVGYDLGVDKNSNEPLAKAADQCIQPITYVGILKMKPNAKIVQKPKNYNRDKYKCVIKGSHCPYSNSLFNMDRLKNYGKMPNNKLMINIPSHSYGNDFHATSSNLENYSREEILEEAKEYSQGFIYFIQTELGMYNYELIDEFGTKDKMAKMPYVRESRRLKGVERLTENHITETGDKNRSNLKKNVIAIGDYPIDLHFCKYGRGDIFKEIAPYQIPYGVTIPKKVDGFMVADKNISVSHIANGSTRLQPVTMAVGQAVGTAAAMASKQNIEPRNINVKELQEKLINNDSNLFFFKDLPPQHWAYKDVAGLAIKGLISGYNDLSFKPNNPIMESEMLKIFKVSLITKNRSTLLLKKIHLSKNSQSLITRSTTIDLLYQLLKSNKKIQALNNIPIKFKDLRPGTATYNKVQALASIGVIDNKNYYFRPYENLTRAEAVVLLDRAIDIISG